MRTHRPLVLLSLFALSMLGCPSPSQRGHSPRDAARGDAGPGAEWSDEPYVEDEEESGADDPEEPSIEEPEPSIEEPEGDVLDDADLDPEDPADAEWLDELDDETAEEEGSEAEESVSPCAARCCDGTVVTGEESEGSGQCVREAPALCEASVGGSAAVLRARWDDEIVYRRDRACFARCAHHSSYRRLYGVIRGCTAQATAFCEGPDRGGLADAAWSRCTPG